jgi:hypothetical protein
MEQPKEIEVWLTNAEAAERLRMTKRGLDKLRELKLGPPYRKTGEARNAPVRYPEHLLVQWMQSQKLVMPAQPSEAA